MGNYVGKNKNTSNIIKNNQNENKNNQIEMDINKNKLFIMS